MSENETTKPVSRVRRALAVADRYRWVAYLAVLALVVALPVRGYFAKEAGRRDAKPLPREWVANVNGTWDFSAALRNHPYSFRRMFTDSGDGRGVSFFGLSFYGEYDTWTGTLAFSDLLTEPGAENNLTLSARHEVGHALLDDIVAEQCGPGFLGYLRAELTVQSMKFITRRGGRFLVRYLPADLQAVYRAYVAAKPLNPQGGDDTDANMNEFFAESYANLLTGYPPDPGLAPVFEKYGR